MEEAFDVVVALSQPKAAYYGSQQEQSAAVAEHFAALAKAEREYFPDVAPKTRADVVADINDAANVHLAKQADYVLLFGTSILKPVWLDAFPNRIINLHLGLSPFYRGTATLFWPAANDEIECMGTTIHLAVQKVDAGNILRRIKVAPREGDSYYDLSTRLIRASIDAIPQTVRDYAAGRITPVGQDLSLSKTYRKRDFNEEALKKALAVFGSGLTLSQIARITGSSRCACSQ
jgi:folate-dependent phosphoribosylglycinamide formyltransferase PurN